MLDTGEQFEADHLAGPDGFVLIDESDQEIDSGLSATQMVDRNACIQ